MFFFTKGCFIATKAKFPAFGNLRTKGCHIPIGCYHCGMVPNKKALGTPRQPNLISEIGTKINCVWTAWTCREAPAASSSCNFVTSHQQFERKLGSKCLKTTPRAKHTETYTLSVWPFRTPLTSCGFNESLKRRCEKNERLWQFECSPTSPAAIFPEFVTALLPRPSRP